MEESAPPAQASRLQKKKGRQGDRHRRDAEGKRKRQPGAEGKRKRRQGDRHRCDDQGKRVWLQLKAGCPSSPPRTRQLRVVDAIRLWLKAGRPSSSASASSSTAQPQAACNDDKQRLMAEMAELYEQGHLSVEEIASMPLVQAA
jgi:hypothetical protein